MKIKRKIMNSSIVAEAQKLELDKCLTVYHENANAGSPWKSVKQRIMSK